MSNVVDNLVEVRLPKENFLKVKETLERIGVSNNKNELFQSCHILSKSKGEKYFIVHFKELFMLDGKQSSLSEEDIGRRNKIIELLQEWKLLTVVDPEKIKEPIVPISKIKIIQHGDRDNWTLTPKYNIGVKK